MSDDLDVTELEENERRRFSSLPREMEPDPLAEDRVVAALRAEGFFARRRAVWQRIAASAALVLGGALAGAILGMRLTDQSSLEAQLARGDLTRAEQILLLQRAGSAYVRAAHAYADVTAKADSAALEVARQVLVGAAHAVVRNQLDAGIAARLTSVLQEPIGRQVRRSPNDSPVIWF